LRSVRSVGAFPSMGAVGALTGAGLGRRGAMPAVLGSQRHGRGGEEGGDDDERFHDGSCCVGLP